MRARSVLACLSWMGAVAAVGLVALAFALSTTPLALALSTTPLALALSTTPLALARSTTGTGAADGKAGPVSGVSKTTLPVPTHGAATRAAVGIPTISLGLTEAGKPVEVANILKILILLTVLSLAPAILILMTSFTRIVVVLSFLRQAIGTQQMPPNQLIIGLSLFLTFFVMAPTFKTIHASAIEPYMDNRLSQGDAWTRAEGPLRAFMFKQTREKDLEVMMGLAKLGKPKNREEVPTYVLVPAFVLSELKTSFQMGFMLYLPFLILDMVVSSVLMAMGMMMLPPVVISLPFKLLLFVLVDGWQLVVGSLVKSFG